MIVQTFHINETPKIKKEDLIAEVQRLRAENVYLKKLNALVAERVLLICLIR